MKDKLIRLEYIVSTALFGLLAVVFFFVMVNSFMDNTLYMCNPRTGVGFTIYKSGNYMGLFAGFLAYVLSLGLLLLPRVRHNMDWFMRFTHELTHTLVALLFFGKIREFVVRDRECYVSYQTGPIGYVPITLSPYCMPIYTFMLFPFRFAGDSHYMIIFDFLIAFTYAFHIHAFIKQTRFSQPDIANCGRARSVAFITFFNVWVLSLVLAIPRGGVVKALFRVCYEYPMKMLSDPHGWFISVFW
jgi:hypothetical protein